MRRRAARICRVVLASALAASGCAEQGKEDVEERQGGALTAGDAAAIRAARDALRALNKEKICGKRDFQAGPLPSFPGDDEISQHSISTAKAHVAGGGSGTAWIVRGADPSCYFFLTNNHVYPNAAALNNAGGSLEFLNRENQDRNVPTPAPAVADATRCANGTGNFACAFGLVPSGHLDTSVTVAGNQAIFVGTKANRAADNADLDYTIGLIRPAAANQLWNGINQALGGDEYEPAIAWDELGIATDDGSGGTLAPGAGIKVQMIGHNSGRPQEVSFYQSDDAGLWPSYTVANGGPVTVDDNRAHLFDFPLADPGLPLLSGVATMGYKFDTEAGASGSAVVVRMADNPNGATRAFAIGLHKGGLAKGGNYYDCNNALVGPCMSRIPTTVPDTDFVGAGWYLDNSSPGVAATRIWRNDQCMNVATDIHAILADVPGNGANAKLAMPMTVAAILADPQACKKMTDAVDCNFQTSTFTPAAPLPGGCGAVPTAVTTVLTPNQNIPCNTVVGGEVKPGHCVPDAGIVTIDPSLVAPTGACGTLANRPETHRGTCVPDPEPAVCGNNTIEEDELCDGANLNGWDCVILGYTGGTLACDATCYGHDVSGCTSEAGPVCGNGIIEDDELCDGANLNGWDCAILGYTGGTLACDATCYGHDVSGCTSEAGPVCGNGIIEDDELCDGANLNGWDCASLGYTGGTLACDATCYGFDDSGCTEETAGPVCGDGIVDGAELCDGTSVSCEIFGYSGGGYVQCAPDCGAIDASQCVTAPTCGNGIVEDGELCDGGAASCDLVGGGGTFFCTATCDGFDLSECTSTLL